MSRAVVCYRFVGFSTCLHSLGSFGNGGVDTSVVSSVETIDRRFDARHGVFSRRRAVENESAGDVTAVAGETEGLSATPAEAGHKQFLARSRELETVVGSGIEVGGDLIGRQL